MYKCKWIDSVDRVAIPWFSFFRFCLPIKYRNPFTQKWLNNVRPCMGYPFTVSIDRTVTNSRCVWQLAKDVTSGNNTTHIKDLTRQIWLKVGTQFTHPFSSRNFFTLSEATHSHSRVVSIRANVNSEWKAMRFMNYPVAGLFNSPLRTKIIFSTIAKFYLGLTTKLHLSMLGFLFWSKRHLLSWHSTVTHFN